MSLGATGGVAFGTGFTPGGGALNFGGTGEPDEAEPRSAPPAGGIAGGTGIGFLIQYPNKAIGEGS